MQDIEAQIATGLSKEIVYRTSVDYLKKSIPVAKYSVTILRKAKIFFNRFTAGYFEEPSVAVQGKSTGDAVTTVSPLNLNADSKIFAVQSVTKDYHVTKCVNGDGVLFGTTLKEVPPVSVKKEFGEPRKKNIEFVNYLIDVINKNNIKAFIFLCPMLNDKTNFDKELSVLRKELKAPILDMTKSIPPELKYWSDTDPHLSNDGRLLFSKELMNEMAKYNIPNERRTLLGGIVKE